ncbi:MAG: histidine phosphatase family protein [Thermoplasmata archaeon]|nr:histidine phosphatase family protein [Thermoplasmata archaeon]
MRSIDYRRHAERDPGAVHLNATGLAMARRIGALSEPFDRVVTSPIPRAVETAEAMGAHVTETRPELATLGPVVEAELGPIVGWSDYAEAVRRSHTVARYAAIQRAVLLDVVRRLTDGGRALVVSHGGVLEIGAVAALPQAPHDRWGASAGFCEGIHLVFHEGRFTEGEPLRVGGAR